MSPCSSLGELCVSDAKKTMKRNGALFLRWESEFDKVGESSWWHVIKDQADTLDSLPKKTRYLIRKALKLYDARPIDSAEVLENGYAVYSKAYERYDTHEPFFSPEKFSQAILELPRSTEFWGVHEKKTGKLVAFSENYVEGETCFFVTMWLDPEAMANFAGYLLFYEMEQHYLDEREFLYISDGARSLSHSTNIHDFLIGKFRYRKAHSRLHVLYNPWLRAAVIISYPIRNIIKKIQFGPFLKASILLKQEEIRQECCGGSS